MRSLLRAPIFTATVVATLVLGLVSVITLFSVTDALLLRPLPYSNSDRLVTINNVLAADFRDIQARNNVFDRMTLYSPGAYVLSRGGDARRLMGTSVSPDFFPMVGVSPAIGRAFAQPEFRPGRNDVVLLSHSLWVRNFGSDSHVLGTSIILNSKPYTVIGVLPRQFRWRQRWLDNETDVWLPLALNTAQLQERGAPIFNSRGPTKDYYSSWVLARLRHGTTLGEAQRDFHNLVGWLISEHSEDKVLQNCNVYSIRFVQAGPIGGVLWPLLGGAGLILLVACLNVSGLMLARGLRRRQEVAVRFALGASRARIALHLMGESLLISVLGTIVAVPLSLGSLRIFRALAPAQYTTRFQDAGIDGRVLLFVLAAILISTLLSGMIPALALSHSRLYEDLKGGFSIRPLDRTRGGPNLQRLLVASEIGAALVLLTGASLMTRSLWLTMHQRLGFDPGNVSSISVTQVAGFQNGRVWSGRTREFEGDVLREARALPFVQSAAIAGVPFTGAPELPLVIGQTDVSHVEDMPVAYWWNVSPGFLSTLRIPLLQGRDFTNADGPNKQPVVLVSQGLADTYFSGVNPLGRHIEYVAFDPGPKKVDAQIVGVVGDTKMAGLTWPIRPELYTCVLQSGFGGDLLVRSQVPLALLTAAMREIVQDASGDFGLSRVKPIDQAISESSVARPRFLAFLLFAFATLAVGLTAVGVVGAVSFNVLRRTREIGIRMALGAQHADVVRVVLFDSLATTAIGLGAGLAGSLALARLIRTWLYGIRPDDPLTLAISSALLALLCATAAYVPARRAIRVDPLVALRHE